MEFTVRKKILIGSLVLAIIAGVIGGMLWYRQPQNQHYDGVNMSPAWDVADNIQNGSQNTLFAKQIQQVDYYTFLHGGGPFTIFVPTDKAYNNLPANDQDLLNSDTGSLRQILLYHIVKGSYRMVDLKDGMTLHTIQGDAITVKRNDDEIILDGYAYISSGDIISKNGVIHLMTNYLLPPSILH